jgi:tRNA G10  N-methylase Trm11
MQKNELRESIFCGKDADLLPQMFSFYAPYAKEIRDVTANTRKMWKGVQINGHVMWYDCDSSVFPDVVCSWDHLPDRDHSIDVLVYDPPHLPLAAASKLSKEDFIRSYGLDKSVKGDNTSKLFYSFLQEAIRVLVPGGLIFAKIKDYIHNHRYQWNLESFNRITREIGMTPCDLIIKRDPCGGNLKSGKWRNLKHIRNCHCYWVIIRNSNKCEGKQ